MVDRRTAQLLPFLMRVFGAHDVVGKIDGDWVVFSNTDFRANAAIVVENVRDTYAWVQLDVGFAIGPGRLLLESFAGMGADVDAAVTDAMNAFVHSSLHVLLAAFFGKSDDHQITRESWRFCTLPASAILGNVIGRGRPPGGRSPHQWFDAFARGIAAIPLSRRTHWIRVYVAQLQGELTMKEVLLDNEPWAEGQAILDQCEFPRCEDFYSVRIFLVTTSGFDASRAINVMHRMNRSDDDAIRAELESLGATREESRDLVDYLPIACGRTLLAKLGVATSDEGVHHAADRQTTFRLLEDPIYADACALAAQLQAEGPRDVLSSIALRSAEVSAVNQALNSGSQAADLVLSPPIFSR